jgi:hypothetical protein
MTIEKSFNSYGQEQHIDNFDRVIKIEDKFLIVRLIRTQKWKSMQRGNKEFTNPMPRARFAKPDENPYYLIRKSDLLKMRDSHAKNRKKK